MGKPHKTWDTVVRKCMKMLIVQMFRGFCLSLLLESMPVCQDIFAPTFSVVLCDHHCVVAYTSICFVEIG